MHTEQDPRNTNSWIKPLRNEVHRLQQFFKSTQRQVMRLHWYKHFVCNRECVDAQYAQTWRAIKKHYIVISVDRLKLGAQHGLHALLLREFTFYECQLRDGRNEIKPRARGLHCVFNLTRRVKQQIANGTLLWTTFYAKVKREIRLRIKINKQHALPVARERSAKIDSARGLANPALLVEKRDHARLAGGSCHRIGCVRIRAVFALGRFRRLNCKDNRTLLQRGRCVQLWLLFVRFFVHQSASIDRRLPLDALVAQVAPES